MPESPRETPSIVRLVSWGVSAIAVVLGLFLLPVAFGLASAAFSDDFFIGGSSGLVLAAIVLGVAALILGTSVAFFRAQTSGSRANPHAPSFSFVFAGCGLLFGLFMILTTFGCLLEAAFPDGFGRFPDPELAPWACCAAAVTLVPGLAFFRSQCYSRFTAPRSPFLGLFVLLFIGFPLVVVCGAGLLAAFPLELLPAVDTLPALLMSTAAITLAVPVFHLGLALCSGFGHRRDSPSGTNRSPEN